MWSIPDAKATEEKLKIGLKNVRELFMLTLFMVDFAQSLTRIRISQEESITQAPQVHLQKGHHSLKM